MIIETISQFISSLSSKWSYEIYVFLKYNVIIKLEMDKFTCLLLLIVVLCYLNSRLMTEHE